MYTAVGVQEDASASRSTLHDSLGDTFLGDSIW